MSEDIDYGNLGKGSAFSWTIAGVKFVAVKLEGYAKSSLDVSGAVQLTGVAGKLSKDKQIVNDWLVFVLEGGKVSTLETWDLQKAADTVAMSTGASANVIFKDVHDLSKESVDDSTQQG